MGDDAIAASGHHPDAVPPQQRRQLRVVRVEERAHRDINHRREFYTAIALIDTISKKAPCTVLARF